MYKKVNLLPLPNHLFLMYIHLYSFLVIQMIILEMSNAGLNVKIIAIHTFLRAIYNDTS